MAHAALVAGFGFLYVGQEQEGCFTRLNARRRFRLGARLGEFLCVERRLGNDEQGFDIVRTHRFQPFGAL